MTTATPRRRDRAPLSSIDSNVVGSLKKKHAAASRSPTQQKRYSTKKTAKTPGTKRTKRRQNPILTVDTPRIESPLFKQQTVHHDLLQPAETVSENAADADADASSLTQLSGHVPKYTFGSSGVFYDSQQWEAEQSEAFKSWLNHLFHPDPQIDAVGEEQRSAELNAAIKLFNSRRMTAIRFAIEREVTEGRLAITPRAGRNILDEVYVQEQLSMLILSYTPRWLQLGLKVVLAHYGDQSFYGHHDMTKDAMKKLILEQVLSKPSIIQKYTAGQVNTASGYFEKMLRVELQQHTLSVLLILVFFLDEAKARQLLTEDPVLFEKTSPVKSSQEMLVSLCQDCFAKQRSILNHLEYEGVSVSHVQEPLDEYDFRVRNFAVDLKDGVCLARMVDIVTNGCNILSSLRLPADSRKHKMYNVRLALAALRQLGVQNISDITPAHIVDAHQPRIIQLVWSTILYFELPEFRQEIIQYKASRLMQAQARRFLVRKRYNAVLGGCLSLQSLFRGVQVRKVVIEMNVAAKEIQKIWRGYDAKVRYGFNLLGIITIQSVARRFLACKRIALLSTRTNASIQIQRIWRGYSQKIRYGFLLMDVITVQSVFRNQLAVRRAAARLEGVVKVQSAARVWIAKRIVTRYRNAIVTVQSAMRKALALQHVDCQMKELCNDDDSEDGEVIYYSTNQARRRCDKVSLIREDTHEPECWDDEQEDDSTSEEDLMSFSSRASSVSEDLHFATEIEHGLASMVIQTWWRGYLSATRYTIMKNSVIKCQSIWRRKIAKSRIQNMKAARSKMQLASIKITSLCRGYLCRIKYLNMLAATTTIQTFVRMFIAKKIVEDMKCYQIFLMWDESAIKIQAEFRRHICQSTYKTFLAGVMMLQARVRDIHAARKTNDLLRSRAATLIQTMYRSSYASSAFLAQKQAAQIIQSTFRRYIMERKYLSAKKASVLIQATFRSKQVRQSFQLHLKSTYVLQRVGRKFLADVKRKQVAATDIQRIWRGYSTNVDFMLLGWAAVEIQAFARMRSAFTKYHSTRNGIVLAQACFRSNQARKNILTQRNSSIILQQVGRGFLARAHKKQQLAAVAVIQRAMRKSIARSRVQLRSCMMIQKVSRGCLARMQKKHQLAAVIIIQRVAKEMITRSRKHISMLAAIEIQRVWRGFSAHMNHMMQVSAVMKIQSKYREVSRKRALLSLSSQRKSIIIIQKLGRGFLERVKTKRAQSAVNVIQRATREMISRSRSDIVRNAAASEIQRIWRGFSAHVDYMLQVMAVIRIQSNIRRFLMKKRLRHSVQMNEVSQEDVVNSLFNEASMPKPSKQQKQERRLELSSAESPEKSMNSPPRVIDVIAYESNSNKQVDNASAIPKFITTASYIATPTKIHVRNLSKYEKHTAKAIKVLRKNELFSEVMAAVTTLEKTTSKSIDSCELLLQARAQDNLLSLLASCNRSSPHLELVRAILHILKNIASHEILLPKMVTKDSLSIMTDVIQMFRDKANIFELSTFLMETFVQSDSFTLLEYSSHEQQRRLRGVLSMSRKRALIRSCPELDKGLQHLGNVVRIIDGGQLIKSKCPYCHREFK